MAKNRKRNQKAETSISSLEGKIIALLYNSPLKSFTLKSVIKRLGFHSKIVNNQVPVALSNLVKAGKIEVHRGNYISKRKPDEAQGRVDHVSSRFAYVVMEEGPDIYVKAKDMLHALHDDIVKIAVYSSKHGGKKEGRITEIVKRAKTNYVGRVEVSKNYGFLVVDNKKVHEDFFIPEDGLNEAQNGDKVIFEITQWPTDSKSAQGKVIRVLGKAGEHNAEIHSIMAEYDLPFEFPQEVEHEANAISDDISDEAKHRRDMRGVLTFTIDPFDAKDFDDALSLEVLPNGNYEIGIHIADVTHYVLPKSELEKEAFHRATSVYLVDRTIPMLPERLSNGLCSLRPEEDKLTFSAIFEINDKAKVLNQWFGRTIIHSNRRFTYEEAQQGIETGEGDFASELITLNELAKMLREERFKKGAVNFETTEVKFRLDEKGTPIEVVPKIRVDSHKLIEEFMLLANKMVATFVFKRQKGKIKDTFVYRTHDDPNPEKIADFALFAKRFGHDLDVAKGGLSNSINMLLHEIEGQPEENVLQTLAIRSMAKAIYTTEEKGHFGLAFDHYTHFTSPIRRYPDMMVHRLLQHYLDNNTSKDREEIEKKCKHSSDMEKRASEAERASIKYKQVEFMETMKGRDFEGVISGVTEWGIYVEVRETACEGMIRLTDLKDDFYEFDERNYRVVGSMTRNTYTLGDDIKVRVKHTDIDKRIIDLELVWG